MNDKSDFDQVNGNIKVNTQQLLGFQPTTPKRLGMFSKTFSSILRIFENKNTTTITTITTTE